MLTIGEFSSICRVSTKTLIHYGNGWGTTDAGAKFSMWHKGVLNSDSWHPELVDEIAKFLKK